MTVDSECNLRQFQEQLTARLQRLGVPATPSWSEAFDWLDREVVRLRRESKTRNIWAVRESQARQDAEDKVHRLCVAAKRVLEADMRGVRDVDALNELEDAAGFTSQEGRAT